MNPYLKFVQDYVRLQKQGKDLPLGGLAPTPGPAPSADAPRVLIFSPHPDDECIVGGLPLRLMREAGMRVTNVAVTQGSKKERQTERYQELQQACRYLGYELRQIPPHGLEKVNGSTRQKDPAFWSKSAAIIRDILRENEPNIIFFPHDQDWNSTHIGTHFLVLEALRELDKAFSCFVVETEFWGQMASPNLMVESSAEDVAGMVAGTSFHVGEVRRNPFHLFLPAWMQDNVRRGSELVGGQGEAAPDFSFATLYRLRRWRSGALENVFAGGKFLPCSANPASLFS